MNSGRFHLTITGGTEQDRQLLRHQLAALSAPPPAPTLAVDLDAPYSSFGCVILASGLGTRFGGNKLLAPFCGEPLLCRALTATEGIFSRRVVVTRHPEIARLCGQWGVASVLHQMPHRSDTVRLGLEAVGNVDGCLFCPGDQPLLSRETVAALALWAKNDPQSILRPAWQQRFGAPVFFPGWTFPLLMTLPQGKGGGAVAARFPRQVRLLQLEAESELLDVDTRQDLIHLESMA